MRNTFSILIGLLIACHPQAAIEPVPQHPYDGGPLSSEDDTADGSAQSVYGRACSNLRLLKCRAGFSQPNEDECTVVLRKGQESHLADFHPDCLAKAKTQADVRDLCHQKCTPVQ